MPLFDSRGHCTPLDFNIPKIELNWIDIDLEGKELQCLGKLMFVPTPSRRPNICYPLFLLSPLLTLQPFICLFIPYHPCLPFSFIHFLSSPRLMSSHFLPFCPNRGHSQTLQQKSECFNKSYVHMFFLYSTIPYFCWYFFTFFVASMKTHLCHTCVFQGK